MYEHVTFTFTENIENFSHFKNQILDLIAQKAKNYLSEKKKINSLILETEEHLKLSIKQRDLMQAKYDAQKGKFLEILTKKEIEGRNKFVDLNEIQNFSDNILNENYNQQINKINAFNIRFTLDQFKNLFKSFKEPDFQNMKQRLSEDPSNKKLLKFLNSSRQN